jgi:hypothetical protein
MAHPDLDALLNEVFAFAQQMLAKHGEFYPIGATVGAGGEIALVARAAGSEHPPSQEVIDSLIAGLREQASKNVIRACAVCYDGRVVRPGETRETDAICALLERESGEATAVFLPYRRGLLGRISYGELFANSTRRLVFTVGG